MLSDAQIMALPKPSRAEAARFLSQATLGYNLAEVNDLVSRGYWNWLNTQFSFPLSKYPRHIDWIKEKYPPNAANNFLFHRMTSTALNRAVTGSDVLRQKMTFSLSQVLTLSIAVDLQTAHPYLLGAGYYDLLQEGAFGTYLDLLKKVSRSVAMARFLTFVNSQKANSLQSPDQNYARELQQLFTIGVEVLDEVTGIPVMDPQTGKIAETYGRDEIVGLADIFTGWYEDFSQLPSGVDLEVALFDSALQNLKNNSEQHETKELKLSYKVGRDGSLVTGAAGHPVNVDAGSDATARMNKLLEDLYLHPNVPFFISRQLIQRFTTSAPSFAYVKRVADAFKSGTRGDLRTVIKAILFDEDLFTGQATTNPLTSTARRNGMQGNATFGKLREPYARLVHWARAFGATSRTGLWDTGIYGGSLHNPVLLGQAPLQAASVINSYRSGYVPPGSETAKEAISAGSYTTQMTAPEFQITDEVTTVAYVNFMHDAINPEKGVSGMRDITSNYTAWLSKATNVPALLADLNLVLTANNLSTVSLTRMATALASMPATTDIEKRKRVQAAALLVMASPEYIVQK